MASCDMVFPILRPTKSPSQLGFTPGLFVKLANVLVTEKRGYGLYHNLVTFHQFLDATAAFDKCLQEIILRDIFLSGVDGDNWTYLHQMHKNAEKKIKWQSLTSEETFKETRGTRQGGHFSAEEFKNYIQNMLKDLESSCGEDRLAGVPTSVVGLADDTAPTSLGMTPREAIHNLQPLLYIVENHGRWLHLQFGKKCKLLITAKPYKLKETEKILQSELEILTFHYKSVSQVEEFYVHLAVAISRNATSFLFFNLYNKNIGEI